MSSPPYSPLDGSVALSVSPYRPTVADIGGAVFTNSLTNPPDPSTDPNANDWNNIGKLAVAAANVSPWAVVSVTQSAGTYTKVGLVCLNSNVLIASVTLTKTGTGVVAVDLPTGSMPSSAIAPRAYSNTSGVSATAVASAHGAIVTLLTSSTGAAAEGNFTLEMQGTA